jgi:hypothetical protein
MPIGPGLGMSSPKVAFNALRGSVLMTPMQFGPMSRIP